MQGALAQHIRPLLQSCNTAGILPAVVARDFEFDHNMAAAARKERKKHNASRPPNFDRISKKYRDFDPIAVAVLSDDPTREPDTSRVGSEDLACHDRWLSGWIRASFPGNLCFVHERQHDEYRPEEWAGRFSRRLSIRSCHRVLVTGSFLGNLLSQSRLRHSHRIVFGLIAGLVATVAGFEWSGLRNIYFQIALLCLAMGMTNPALSKIGAEPVSLTFVTGTLSRIGGHLASAAGRKPLKERLGPGDSHLARAMIEASVWCGFLAGAVLSGIAGAIFRTWALLPPCVVMLTLGLFSECATPTRENTV